MTHQCLCGQEITAGKQKIVDESFYKMMTLEEIITDLQTMLHDSLANPILSGNGMGYPLVFANRYYNNAIQDVITRLKSNL